MTLEELRLIVTTNMPYDTGYMSLAGASFYDTPHFMKVKYDTERVPYIIYNEEGTIYTTVNQGFIREKTMGHLLRHEEGVNGGMNEQAKRRGSTDMIKEGALDKIRQEGKLYGYR